MQIEQLFDEKEEFIMANEDVLPRTMYLKKLAEIDSRIDELKKTLVSLNEEKQEILDMELLPKKLRKKYKEEKYGILDVRVRLREGEQLNIEMQSIAYDYWQERSLFYLGKMYVDRSTKGKIMIS